MFHHSFILYSSYYNSCLKNKSRYKRFPKLISKKRKEKKKNKNQKNDSQNDFEISNENITCENMSKNKFFHRRKKT